MNKVVGVILLLFSSISASAQLSRDTFTYKEDKFSSVGLSVCDNFIEFEYGLLIDWRVTPSFQLVYNHQSIREDKRWARGHRLNLGLLNYKFVYYPKEVEATAKLKNVFNIGYGYSFRKALRSNWYIGVGLDANYLTGGVSTAPEFTESIGLTTDNGKIDWLSNFAIGPRYEVGYVYKSHQFTLEYRHKMPIPLMFESINDNVYVFRTNASAVYQTSFTYSRKIFNHE